MAYALRLGAAIQGVNIPSGNYYGNLDTWELEFEIKFNGGPSTEPFYAITDGSGFNNYVRVGLDGSADNARIRYGSTTLEWPVQSQKIPDDGLYHVIKFVRRVGGEHEYFFDGISQGVITNTIKDTNTSRSAIGHTDSLPSEYTIKYQVLRDAEGGNVINNWDANASNGTGGTLPDTAGSLNGTIISPEVGDAHWIFYDNGAPTVTLAANPQLGATLSFTYANYAGIPVGPLAFDQGARSLPDEAVTITDNGDGSGSGVTDTALPGLPANGESVTPFPLIGENITITLPDPGV